MSGVVSLSYFLKSPNPLRLMILNAKKMTPLSGAAEGIEMWCGKWKNR